MAALESLLYRVTAWDPRTYLGVSVVVVLMALVSGCAPALRASRLDPLAALRDE